MSDEWDWVKIGGVRLPPVRRVGDKRPVLPERPDDPGAAMVAVLARDEADDLRATLCLWQLRSRYPRDLGGNR